MNIPQSSLNLIVGLSILVGAIECFFGYRLFKIVLGLIGFLVGSAVASAIAAGLSQQGLIILGAGLLGGCVGAALMVLLYFLGVFVVGALLGGILGTVLFALVESQPEPLLLLILAVIAGIVALVFQKLMIICSTGFGGAWSVVTGTAYFTVGAIDPRHFERLPGAGGNQLYVVLLCWLALGIAGVVVQYKAASSGKNSARGAASSPR